MKNILLLFLIIVISGCTYEGEKISNYIDDPKLFIRDPHFMHYKEKRDDLERRYLRKKITYAEYIEQRQKLDDQYDSDVNRRTAIIQFND